MSKTFRRALALILTVLIGAGGTCLAYARMSSDPKASGRPQVPSQSPAVVPKAETVRRGVGNGMKLMVQGFNTSPSTNFAQTNRTGHTSAEDISGTVDVILPTAYITGRTLAETDLPGQWFFQVALEVAFQEAITGLSTAGRYPFAFMGGPSATTGRYDGPGTNPNGCIKGTLTLPPGVKIPKNTKFGLWTTIEAQAGAANTQGVPYTEVASSFINRNEGQLTTLAGATAGQSHIARNFGMTLTAIRAFGKTQSGSGQAFTPVMLIHDHPATARTAVIQSSSLDYGVGEGQGGSGAFGDVLGTYMRNAGMATRYINERHGHNYVNLSKGGDSTRWTVSPANTVYRDKLLVLANPTHYFEDQDHNAFGISVPNFRANNQAYEAFAVVRVQATAAYWLALHAGTSSAVAPSGTADATDGSVTWRYLGQRTNGTMSDTWAALVAARAKRRAHVRALVPGIKIVGMGMVPDSSVTSRVGAVISIRDRWQSLAGQAPTTGYGPAPSIRSLLHDTDQALRQPMGYGLDARITAQWGVESGYAGTTASETGKWLVEAGTPEAYTIDGVHGSSRGYSVGSASMGADVMQ